jgi:hypothetical protein
MAAARRSSRAACVLLVVDMVVMMAITYPLYCLIYGMPSKAVAALVDEPAHNQRDPDL